jgi:hypothetical protein
MPKLTYDIKKLDPFDSEYMQSLAQRLYQTKTYYEWARRPLLEYWRECDDAYLCYRQLPHNAGMQWTDKSDFGATDVFDGVNMLATRLSLAMMPKDGSWLTVVSRQDDDAKVVEAIQAQQLWMHTRAHSRRMIARHLKQLMVRGTSAMFVDWENRTRRRKISTPQGRRRLKQLMRAGKAPQEAVDLIDDFYIEEAEYIGPRVRVIDALDLYLDPAHDLTVDRRSAYIISTYRRLEELKREVDREGKALYSNLEGLTPWTPTEIYMKDIEGSSRVRNLNTMGVFPQSQPYKNEGYVPVDICYMPYYEHNGEKFFDTYFHIAQSRQAAISRIIRIEQNPSVDGHQFIIKDTMVDWFGNTAYGIGLVEKLLAKYNQKNILEAITLEAALTSVFPAYNVLAGVLRDDTGVSFSPGDINEVAQNPLGLGYIAPMPVPQQGVTIGLQELRWWGEAIASGFGEWGGQSDNPTRSLQTRETATAANIKATTGSLAIDELVEKFSVSLEEFAQLCYDLSRQELEPENGQVRFPQMAGPGQAKQGEISWDQFNVPRDIMVTGLHGSYNKSEQIQVMTEFLKGLAQVANILPAAPQYASSIVERLAAKLDIPVPEQARTDPNQLAAMNPQVKQAVIQQLAQQFPQLVPIVQQAMAAMQQGQKGGGNGRPPMAGGGGQAMVA